MMDLSIVIVSYNTKELLGRCIKSIVKLTKGIEYEITLVNNASTDGSRDIVKKLSKRKKITLINNSKNLGFGQANNVGIKRSCGKYILLLNSDTKVNDNVLGEMIEWMNNKPSVGIATCALKYPDGRVQATGGYFPTLPKVFFWMLFIDDIPVLDGVIKPFHPMHGHLPFLKGEQFYKKEREIDWITGAFMLVRKEVFGEVGGFDKDYFMYTEETDLCYRVKRAGWKVWFIPKWDVIHVGGGSSNSDFPIIAEFKGVKIFYQKHMPTWQYPVLRMLLKLGALIRLPIFGIVKGKWALETYAKAFKIA